MYPAILRLDEIQMLTQSPSDYEINVIALLLQEAQNLYNNLDPDERHVYNFLRHATFSLFFDDFQDIKEIWFVTEDEISQIHDGYLFNIHDLLSSFPGNKIIKKLLLTTNNLFEKYTLTEDLIVYRADHIEKLQSRIDGTQLVFPLPVAFTYNKWSLKQYWGNLDYPLLLACKVPAGMSLIPMEGNPMSGDGEFEVLLAGGTLFEILNHEPLKKEITSALTTNTMLRFENIELYTLELLNK